MLQLERRNHFRGGTKASVDFVSRNKRAILRQSRATRPEGSRAARPDARVEGSRAARPDARVARPDARVEGSRAARVASETTKKQVPPQQQRSKVKQPAPTRGKRVENDAESANTVVVSKKYLDELLRMSVMREGVTVGGSVMRDGVKEVTHVNLDPSEVPGLSPQQVQPTNQFPSKTYGPPSKTYGPPSKQYEPPSNDQGPPPANYQGGSPLGGGGKEAWLSDLAVQAQEQRQRRESERLRRKQVTPDDYFPFGRPGGGAPIRNENGQVMTNLRSRAQGVGGAPPNQLPSVDYSAPMRPAAHHVKDTPLHTNTGRDVPPLATSYLSPTATTGVSPPGAQGGEMNIGSSPRFGRGAGPFVDQYVLQEREEKRKKQMEHMMFVREQVAAKERAKLEERLAREREEREEERRLAKERERMRVEFEREAERAKLKELESLKQQALLKSRLAEAEESARRAKQTARGRQQPLTHSVTFNDPATDGPSGAMANLVPAKYSPTLRSPSMLQLPAESADLSPRQHTTRHDVIVEKGKPPKQRRVQQGESHGVRRRGSRIPVPASSTPVAAERKRRRPGGAARVTERPTPRVVKRERSPSPPVQQRAERGVSPPVPALARRLSNKHSFNTNAPSSDTVKDVPLRPRPPSPPVPALAKRLNKQPSNSIDTRFLPSHTQRPPSPPVPALAKRLARQEPESATDNTATVTHNVPPPSPPVPALVAKRRVTDYDHPAANDSSSVQTDTSDSSVQADIINDVILHHRTTPLSDVQYPINRVPSCSLIVVPDPPPHTPPVAMTMDPQTQSNRQQVILQELAALREGILSQRSHMDGRVQRILSRKKCTF